MRLQLYCAENDWSRFITGANLVEMVFNGDFFCVCRFAQLTGAVVEMCTEFPGSGSSVQYTSGMILLLALNF